MKVWSVCLLLVAVSGCFGTDDESTGVTPQSGDVGEGTNETVNGQANGGGNDPTPTEAGYLDGSLTVDVSSGEAPLSVEFTLDAAAYDPDGNLRDDTTPEFQATYNGNPVGEGIAPNTFSWIFEQLGTHTIVATVSADGFASIERNVTVEVIEPEVPVDPEEPEPIEPVYFDGAENGMGGWTVTSYYTYIDFFGFVPIVVTPVPHDDEWDIDGQAATGAKAFFSHYPDNYRTEMVMKNPITLPGDGEEYVLRMKVIGGAEANGFDGLHVFINNQKQEHIDKTYSSYTEHSYDLGPGTGQSVSLMLRFDSDASCSAATSPPAACGGGSFLGYHVDDIEIIATSALL